MLDTSNMIVFHKRNENRDHNSIRLRIGHSQLVLNIPEKLREELGLTLNDRIKYGVHKENPNILFFVKSEDGVKITKPTKSKNKNIITFTSHFTNQNENMVISKSNVKKYWDYFTIDLTEFKNKGVILQIKK